MSSSVTEPTKSCIRCGLVKSLTFEHIPPTASGDNGPSKLYSLTDTLGTDQLPWDFRGKKFRNAQRGTGGHYLCGDCNHQTGRETVPAYLEMIRQTKDQNILALELSQAKNVTWSVRFQDIEPHAIAQQIMLMIACMNNHHFVSDYADLFRILNDNTYTPQTFGHGLYLFINAGALSTSYPVTALGGLNASPMAITGVYAGIYSFHMEINGRTNPFAYADISSWITDYAYGQRASFTLQIPIIQTNVGLPGSHSSRAEIVRRRNESKKQDAERR